MAKIIILNNTVTSGGYCQVSLYAKGVRKLASVHRIVAMAFCPIPEGIDVGRLHVNHIDGLRQHNDAYNLEWVTPSENQLHAIKLGLKPVGEQTNLAILTSGEIPIIRLARESGETYTAIAKRHSVSVNTISSICQRKSWKHVA